MAAIISICVRRIARLFGLTASAAVTATTALGATPSTGKLVTALIQPRQEHHSVAVPGLPRTDTAAIEAVALIPQPAVLAPASAIGAWASLTLPEQRSMPGWLAARAAIEAKRSAARKRNSCKPIPRRTVAAPKRRTTRVVWHSST